MKYYLVYTSFITIGGPTYTKLMIFKESEWDPKSFNKPVTEITFDEYIFINNNMKLFLVT